MGLEVQGNETAKDLIQLLENASHLSKFQYINLLIMLELLSLADHQFVTDAKNIFIAVNRSQTGEISFNELTDFLNASSTQQRDGAEVKTLFTKFHPLCNHSGEDPHKSISWSEWLVLIASKT